MGPLQHLEFWKQMKTTAADPKTAPADAANLNKLLAPGIQQWKARRAFEKQAATAITAKALESGMTADELSDAELADATAILPSGWFQALLAALPTILSFVESILKLFGIG